MNQLADRPPTASATITGAAVVSPDAIVFKRGIRNASNRAIENSKSSHLLKHLLEARNSDVAILGKRICDSSGSSPIAVTTRSEEIFCDYSYFDKIGFGSRERFQFASVPTRGSVTDKHGPMGNGNRDSSEGNNATEKNDERKSTRKSRKLNTSGGTFYEVSTSNKDDFVDFLRVSSLSKRFYRSVSDSSFSEKTREQKTCSPLNIECAVYDYFPDLSSELPTESMEPILEETELCHNLKLLSDSSQESDSAENISDRDVSANFRKDFTDAGSSKSLLVTKWRKDDDKCERRNVTSQSTVEDEELNDAETNVEVPSGE